MITHNIHDLNYNFTANIIINKTHDTHDLNYATTTYDL